MSYQDPNSTTPSLTPQVFSGEQKKKLVQIVQDGINVLEEIEALKAGLKDTIEAVAEEMEIRTAVLNKAIKIAHRNNFSEAENDLANIENILKTVGRL